MGGAASVASLPAGTGEILIQSLITTKTSSGSCLERASSASSKRSIHADAHSFRSKAGTLKMLIRNKVSRQAFFAFLELVHVGKDQFLSAFLILEGIRKDVKTDFTEAKIKLVDMICNIEEVTTAKGNDKDSIEEQIFLITENLKDCLQLDQEVVARRISQAQDELLLRLTPYYDDFLKSDNYKEFEICMMEKEKKTYRDKSCDNSIRTFGKTASVQALGSQRNSFQKQTSVSVITHDYIDLATVCVGNSP